MTCTSPGLYTKASVETPPPHTHRHTHTPGQPCFSGTPSITSSELPVSGPPDQATCIPNRLPGRLFGARTWENHKHQNGTLPGNPREQDPLLGVTGKTHAPPAPHRPVQGWPRVSRLRAHPLARKLWKDEAFCETRLRRITQTVQRKVWKTCCSRIQSRKFQAHILGKRIQY